MLKNTQASWGIISRLFHWVIALMVVTLLTVGLIMTGMEPGAEKWKLYGLHKATGMTVLALVILRLFWRVFNPVPALPKGLSQWQMIAAYANIYFLYLLLFCMPLSGFIMSVFGGHDIDYFGLVTIKAVTQGQTPLGILSHAVHITLAYVIIGVVSLHVAAALYHQFYLKNNLLRRMITGKPL
ncbi:hypothetical protein Cva_00934 [Caedimonas varicaedens]|jgi:cytochrome b561|uniref:Cytochrome b561 bacterial/Ni-hydrogenase domain-containing protein n=1 Tax=Caedimonas varicaedens TaxID=1629334 RepID=A0A0K8MCL1_9PROT|nr:hypothetical protein Cva_00934 [Caedimonas varicaedens]